MKNLNSLNGFRIYFQNELNDEYNGYFEFDIEGVSYFVSAHTGVATERVSVSMFSGGKIPSWKVVRMIKDKFFEKTDEKDCEERINITETALHVWRERPTKQRNAI